MSVSNRLGGLQLRDRSEFQRDNFVHLELVQPARSDAAPTAVDRTTFESWYEQSVEDVFGFFARRVGPDRAEDLTAEVYMRAWKCRHTFEAGRGVPRAWLFGIARNLMKDHLRSEQRQLRAYSRASNQSRSDADEAQFERAMDRADMDRFRPVVASALLELSADELDILWLHAGGQLSYHEMAEVLDVAVGTVRSRLSRARKRLAGLLSHKKELVSGAS